MRIAYNYGMEKQPCVCSNLDWRDVNMTLEHHPNCPLTHRQEFVTNLHTIGKYSSGSERHLELKQYFYNQSIVEMSDDGDPIKMLCKIKGIQESFSSKGIEMRIDWEVVEIISPPELREEWLMHINA